VALCRSMNGGRIRGEDDEALGLVTPTVKPSRIVVRTLRGASAPTLRMPRAPCGGGSS